MHYQRVSVFPMTGSAAVCAVWGRKRELPAATRRPRRCRWKAASRMVPRPALASRPGRAATFALVERRTVGRADPAHARKVAGTPSCEGIIRSAAVAPKLQGPGRARQRGRADHPHRGNRQRQRERQAGRQRFHRPHRYGDTQPDADAPRGERKSRADDSSGIRYNRPGTRGDYSRRAATSNVRHARRLPSAEQCGELLRTRRILPQYRPRGIRDSWRRGSDHL